MLQCRRLVTIFGGVYVKEVENGKCKARDSSVKREWNLGSVGTLLDILYLHTKFRSSKGCHKRTAFGKILEDILD